MESGVQERGRTVGEKLYIGTGNIAQLAITGSAFTSKHEQAVCPTNYWLEQFCAASLASDESACY